MVEEREREVRLGDFDQIPPSYHRYIKVVVISNFRWERFLCWGIVVLGLRDACCNLDNFKAWAQTS